MIKKNGGSRRDSRCSMQKAARIPHLVCEIERPNDHCPVGTREQLLRRPPERYSGTGHRTSIVRECCGLGWQLHTTMPFGFLYIIIKKKSSALDLEYIEEMSRQQRQQENKTKDFNPYLAYRIPESTPGMLVDVSYNDLLHKRTNNVSDQPFNHSKDTMRIK